MIRLADRAATDLASIAVLADACGGRRATAARLLCRMSETSRLSRRSWLTAILADVQQGTCSVLEHGYLTRVERPHWLPQGRRQVRAVSERRPMFRDVLHSGKQPAWEQIVELDGRLFHSSPEARDRDLERDLDAALSRIDTVRLGYGQVFERPCRTASKLGRLFQIRGWADRPRRCPSCS